MAMSEKADDDKGKPLKIIDLEIEGEDDNVRHQLKLNKSNLEKVMLHSEVKDRPVVIVSVAGACRTGKSFLLGFFLKYLETEEDEWLTENDTIKGFEWRSGCDLVTTGIYIWSKPYIRVNKSGQKVAVLLMDTQGIFDNQSTIKECAGIFSLSNLLSSVQIYNLSRQIRENDLQYLELFTEYGRLTAEMSENYKPNQSRLIFLVRDWPYPKNHQFGETGGKSYIRSVLQVNRRQGEELKNLRKNICSSFPNTDGFLLPYPGMAVDTNSDFKGRVNEEKLVTKTIDCLEIKGKDWVQFVSVVVDSFEKGPLSPKSALDGTVEFWKQCVIDTAFDLYEKEMEKFCWIYHGKKLPVKQFEERHDMIRKKAIQQLNDLPKFRDITDAQVRSLFSQLESRSKAKHDSLLLDIERKNEELAAEFRKKALAFAGTAAATAAATAATVAAALIRK
uniref:Atlastin-2-like isoform X2 n=1 Tax=Crassostrea virginica TaxID=6565 RepID=A0A8B8E5U4_CRAVI|nr:atlastin-2-like isoform X2 [Crassostrea virginica]